MKCKTILKLPGQTDKNTVMKKMAAEIDVSLHQSLAPIRLCEGKK